MMFARVLSLTARPTEYTRNGELRDLTETRQNKLVKKNPCLFTQTEGIRVVWGITEKCNLRCKHCAADTGLVYPSAQLPRPESGEPRNYSEIIKEMEKTGVDTVYLSGGEPLKWEGIFDVIEEIKGNGMVATVGTNGTSLDRTCVEKLAEVKIDKVFVSLDHWEREKHDFLRGGKAFDKAVEGIKSLKEEGIYTRIDSIIWKGNYRGVEKLVEFGEKLGVDEMVFAWPMKVGRAKENPEILPPETEYFNVGRKLKRLKEEYSGRVKISFHRFDYFGEDSEDCAGGRKILYVDHHGRVSPCFWVTCLFPEFFTKSTVFHKPFPSLLEDSEIKKFIKMERERYERFGPGCPAVCSVYNGEFHSRDPLLRLYSV